MAMMLAQKERIRCPVVAGMFYPEEKAETLDYIRAYGLEQGKGGQAKAIIAPHGAWVLSGALAAAAFSAAGGRRGSISRVVILGPLHRRQKEGLYLSNSHSFQTPLGMLPVDQDISEDLKSASGLFKINDIPHLEEHSIEVLLPFVKFCFPGASIVPVLMGQPGAESIEALAHALKTVFAPIMGNTLFVVSCNLSKADDKISALLMAKESLRLFSGKNAPELLCAILENRLNACGGGLVASLFASGLLDETLPAVGNMVSAVGEENDTVFYCPVWFE